MKLAEIDLTNFVHIVISKTLTSNLCTVEQGRDWVVTEPYARWR
jgi:hypothetical protein